MRFLVMGAGALGCAFGGMLADGGYEVVLIGRERYMRPIKERGLKITGIWGKRIIRDVVTASKPEQEHRPDVVLLTTKSFDTERAVMDLKPVISRDTIVISLQNGIGNEEIIARHLGEGRTMGGMVITGFEMRAPGEVEVTVSADTTKIGELDGSITERLEEIVAIFNDAGIPAEAVNNINMHIWAKSLYNAALNPLSAIFRVNYGRLLDSNAFAIIREIIKEAFEVAAAEGIKLFWDDPERYLDHLKNSLIPPTARHRSSMLRDIERGKKTEIDFLNGVFVRLGRKHGIPTPVNETIVRSIRFLEGLLQSQMP
ncbi:MAG: 2-dehydropantoate 2-reductase [Candidatus Syntrophoarchaeum butanivorans]|uniref:2-dehydropantoate 2-reductase n=2 Tax=Candidatus Syntropharchaeum butanivorans TaxID=1839936 RepID=A0A1F2P6X4_9EURY|nr:MAG: 2-dehydropantoate 2-reductase [Candidatus Syntrophoarchaeum butanivorans]